MKINMKGLMLLIGLLTALIIVVIMHSGKNSASAIEMSSVRDGSTLQQLVVKKGTHWITQTTYKLLQTN